MGKRSIVFIALCGLIGLALFLIGCNGFFVSPNSVGSITVTPPSALLALGTTPAGTCTVPCQQLTVNATLVSGGSGGDVTSTSTCTSNNSAIVALDTTVAGSFCLMDAKSAGTTFVTVSHSGATAITIPFAVTATPITSITLTSANGLTLSASGTSGSSTLQLVAKALDGTVISNYVTWAPSGGGLTVSSSGVVSASTTLISTSGTVSASLNSAATGGSTVTSNTLTITVNP